MNFLLHKFDSVGSTMDVAKEIPLEQGKPVVVLAETQTAGRGRGEKIWFSPPGAGLYATVVFEAAKSESNYSGFSLAVGVALKRALKQDEIKLKWPNDLLIQRAGLWLKLGGVLIEFFRTEGQLKLAVGLGINLRPSAYPQGVQAISLQECFGEPPEELLVEICTQLDSAKAEFESCGFGAFRADWKASAAFLGERVSIDGERKGVFCDITKDGALLLDKERVYSGELRLA